MSAGQGGRRSISLLHHYVGDDSAAMDEVLATIQRRLDVDVDAIGDADVGLTAKTRLLAGDPPDVWDDWPGENVRPYWNSNVVADVTDLWESAGFTESFFDHARTAATIDGRYYALPTNIQRQNNCFYNVELFEAAGVDPSSIDDVAGYLDALETVEAETDAAGLMLPQKHPWPTFDLWDMLVLAESDADRYEAILQDGQADRHGHVVADALEAVAALLAYVPSDATYQDWQTGLERFVDGGAATFVMGDWAGGVLDSLDGVTYGEDWDAIAFPGTADVYQVVMDALFTPPTSSNREAARDVLREFGSADVLEQFTRIRGAIPPRKDCSMDDHSPFFQRQRTYYDRSSRQVSASRGAGIAPDQRVELLADVASFLTEPDATVEGTSSSMVSTLSTD